MGAGSVISSLPGGGDEWEYLPSLNKFRCKPCGNFIECNNRIKPLAKQHVESGKHKCQLQLSLRHRQTYLDSNPQNDSGNEFYRDLTRAMVKSNIPLFKLDKSKDRFRM